MNSLDLIIIGILMLGLFIGYLRGFLRSIISFGSYFLAFIGAKIFSPKLAKILVENTNIFEKINNSIAGRLGNMNIQGESLPISKITLPNNAAEGVTKNPQFKEIFDKFPFLEKGIGSDALQLGKSISEMLANFVMTAIAFIILFFVIKILVSILGRIINDIIKNFYLLDKTNKLLGLLLGGVTAGIIIVIGLNIITPFVFTSNNTELIVIFKNSSITNLFFNSSLQFNIF